MRAAAADGADLVPLPEKWNLLAAREDCRRGRPLDGPASTGPAPGRVSSASTCSPAASPSGREGEKVCNTSVLIGPDGDDRRLPQDPHVRRRGGRRAYRESEHEEPGEEIVWRDRRGRARPDRLLRPALPRAVPILAVRGARLIAVPSAFTAATGRDHWEVLLRAARSRTRSSSSPRPDRRGAAPYSSYGHSTIVDPWGWCSPPRRRGVLRRRRARPRRPGADPREAALAREPPPAGLRLARAAGGTRHDHATAHPRSTSAERSSMRRSASSRARVPLDPRSRHRRRGRCRLRLVYHYFRSKDEVLDALFSERWRLLLDAIVEADRSEATPRASSSRWPASSSSPTATTPS